MYSVDDTEAKFITTQWHCRKSEIPGMHKALIPWDTRETEGQTEEVFMMVSKPEVNPVESVTANRRSTCALIPSWTEHLCQKIAVVHRQKKQD